MNGNCSRTQVEGPDVLERLMTVDEVAEYLGLNPATVRLHLRNGELVGFKVGPRHWRIRESALEAFVNEREQAAKALPPSE